MRDDIPPLKRWREVASDLDSHKVSALRSDLGMASCGLRNPTDEEIQQLQDIADETDLTMTHEANRISIDGGTNLTVREPEADA